MGVGEWGTFWPQPHDPDPPPQGGRETAAELVVGAGPEARGGPGTTSPTRGEAREPMSDAIALLRIRGFDHQDGGAARGSNGHGALIAVGIATYDDQALVKFMKGVQQG